MVADRLGGALPLLVGAPYGAPLLPGERLPREPDPFADPVPEGDAGGGMTRRHHGPGAPGEGIVPPCADGGDRQVVQACPADGLGKDRADVPPHGVVAPAEPVDERGLPVSSSS